MSIKMCLNKRALPKQLLLEKCGELECYYSPFEYVNKNASIAVVGITPGLSQAKSAIDNFQKSFRETGDTSQSLKSAKSVASFSGPMRSNLVRMLDFIGINELLEIETCHKIFEPDVNLGHFTSVLRNPVFRSGKNYNGTPKIERNSWLLEIAVNGLAEEFRQFKNLPIIVPLGPRVNSALKVALPPKVLDKAVLIEGLPHPSGANAERISYFLEKKSKQALSRQTNGETIDAAKCALIEKVSHLKLQKKL